MSSSRTLQITYVGMKSQDVPIKSGTIKVMMKSDSEVLQEVVVTGMQKMDKRLFTGATKQLNADNVKLDGLPDISRGLEGRAAEFPFRMFRALLELPPRFVCVELLPFTEVPNRCGLLTA